MYPFWICYKFIFGVEKILVGCIWVVPTRPTSFSFSLVYGKGFLLSKNELMSFMEGGNNCNHLGKKRSAFYTNNFFRVLEKEIIHSDRQNPLLSASLCLYNLWFTIKRLVRWPMQVKKFSLLLAAIFRWFICILIDLKPKPSNLSFRLSLNLKLHNKWRNA